MNPEALTAAKQARERYAKISMHPRLDAGARAWASQAYDLLTEQVTYEQALEADHLAASAAGKDLRWHPFLADVVEVVLALKR